MTANREASLSDLADHMDKEASKSQSHYTTKNTVPDVLFDIPLQCSVATKSNGPLTKIMRLNPETGKVIKDGSECWLSEGTLKTELIKSYGRLAKGLRWMKPNQCLVHGISTYDLADVTTVTKLEQAKEGRSADALPIIARSKDHILYPDGPALMMFDHDKARDNSIAENDSPLQSYRPAELIEMISEILPEIVTAGYVSTPSTSACIFDKDGNELRGEGSGSHIYIVVENGRDIPRFLEALGKRLFLAGYGRVEISRSGTLLFRTLVDLLVGSPERLDFAAGAVCRDGLVQKLPEPIVHYGNHLNTALLPDLTTDEELAYKAIKDRLARIARPSQAIVKDKYVEQEASKLSAERKISIDDARVIILSRQDHVLANDDQIYFQHMKGQSVTVADVLNDQASYDKKPLADPLEPEYDGGSLTKAKFYWNNGKRPIIRSFAHGLTEYTFAQFESSKTGNQFKFVSSSALACSPPHWLVKEYLEDDTTVTFFGAPGSMKTFIVMDIGLCISTRKDWHGYKVKQGPVLYICGEGKAGIMKRITAWEVRNKTKAPLFFVSTMAAQMLDVKSLQEVKQAAIEVSTSHGKPALIIIDTLNRNFGPGDENSTPDMTKYIKAVDHLRDCLSCTIATVHHSGLAETDRGRGNSALRGAMDFEYICKKTGSTVDNNTVTLTSTKTKDHEPPDPITFRPRIIDLGILDDDGKPVTSLILETKTTPPVMAHKLSKSGQVALDALISITTSGNAPTADSWRNAAYARSISPSGNPAANRKAFDRAKKNLIDNGLVIEQGDNYMPNSILNPKTGHVDK